MVFFLFNVLFCDASLSPSRRILEFKSLKNFAFWSLKSWFSITPQVRFSESPLSLTPHGVMLTLGSIMPLYLFIMLFSTSQTLASSVVLERCSAARPLQALMVPGGLLSRSRTHTVVSPVHGWRDLLSPCEVCLSYSPVFQQIFLRVNMTLSYIKFKVFAEE